MNQSLRTIFLTLCLASLRATAAEVQPIGVTQTIAGTPATAAADAQATGLQHQDRVLARIWGLSDDEMQRALLLLKGPRAAFSVPNLTPIEALGIHARTPAERRRYAELFARAHHQDVERVLAWAEEFQGAMQRLYPNEPVIGFDNASKPVVTPAAAEANHLPRSAYVPAADSTVKSRPSRTSK